MSDVYEEMMRIHDDLKAISDSIETINRRLDKLEGDKKAVD